MTTLSTLRLEQVRLLEIEAQAAGDRPTERDCELLWEAYLASTEPELCCMLAAEGGDVLAAAERVVAVIRNQEGQW